MRDGFVKMNFHTRRSSFTSYQRRFLPLVENGVLFSFPDEKLLAINTMIIDQDMADFIVNCDSEHPFTLEINEDPATIIIVKNTVVIQINGVRGRFVASYVGLILQACGACEMSLDKSGENLVACGCR